MGEIITKKNKYCVRIALFFSNFRHKSNIKIKKYIRKDGMVYKYSVFLYIHP